MKLYKLNDNYLSVWKSSGPTDSGRTKPVMTFWWLGGGL